MRILIYSQQGGLGGSTRLLLTLARHLTPHHRVTCALGGSTAPEATRALLGRYPELTVVPARRHQLLDERYDVAVLHQPFQLDWSMGIKTRRKIAVIMEVAGRHDPVIGEEQAERFDRILHLHREQVIQFAPATAAKRCLLLPIINNIDFVPTFAKTRSAGTVGGGHKTGLPSMLRLLAALPAAYGLRRWSPDRLSLEGLSPQAVQDALEALASGRLEDNPADVDLRRVYAAFDALLHTPRHGNGTSVVISDALQCGKLLFLAPLPAYREAYAHLPGVLFTDCPPAELARRLRDYSEADFQGIRDAYGRHYDRGEALQRWSQALAE